MENNIEIRKPELKGIPVYVDGQLDQSDAIRRYGSFGLKVIGYGLAKGALATINAIDAMVAAANGHEVEA